ncbi:MAG TPA: YchJ family metal-binding protein [Rhodocyclaceae bacterium]|nr:YchJ family metal-binding protein [Rhodocyclaceae bacterium]
MPRTPPQPPCPCGSDTLFGACCAPLLAGQVHAASALALMRSRYTAYVLGDDAYVRSTWHESTRPSTLEQDDGPPPQWIGLTVKKHHQQDPDHATVEFVARYRIGGRARRLHETSRFLREAGQWFYLDGDIHD